MTSTSSVSMNEVADSRIDHEMVRELYRSAPISLVSSLIAASLLVYVFWVTASPPGLFVWFAIKIIWTVFRFGLVRVVVMQGIREDQTRQWDLVFALISGIAGLIWGASALFAVSLDAGTARMLVPCVIAALSVSAIAGYSRSLPSFAVFLIPCLVPYAAVLVWRDGMTELMIAAAAMAWGGIIWWMARHLNHRFRSRIALTLNNADLVRNLTDARDAARNADLSKTWFLANMSHELRTPLNAIMGYSDMMSQRTLGDQDFGKYDNYPAIILGSGQHLLQIVDKILDISKLEAGAVDLARDQINLPELIDDTVKFMSPDATQDGVSLTVHCPEDLPKLLGDVTRVRQIVLNLLSNAVKFTPRGGQVSISAALVKSGGLEICVEDTGIGISPEDIELALIPYARMENQEHLARVKSLKPDGGRTHTGLGLPLVKLLSELHDATFDLGSTPDIGTIARVSFPVSRVIAGSAPSS